MEDSWERYAIGYESCDLPHNEFHIRHAASAGQ